MLLGAMNNPAREILGEIESFAEMGFDFVEIAVEGPCSLPEELVERKKEIKDLLSGNNIFAITHMPWYFEIGHPYRSIRRAFLKETFKIIDATAQLELELLGVHILPPRGLYRYKLEYNLAALREVLKYSRNHGITPCIENLEPGAFSVEDFKTIFAVLPEAKLLLDIGHANVGGEGEAVFHFIHRFSDRLGHVHAHDNDGSADQHLPIGAGSIEWEKVAQALRKAYDGTITLEIHSEDTDYLRISRGKFEKLWKSSPLKKC